MNRRKFLQNRDGLVIDGICNVYNSTFTFMLNYTNVISGNLTQITVNTDSSGYFFYNIDITKPIKYLFVNFNTFSQEESNKLLCLRINGNTNYINNISGFYCILGAYGTTHFAARNLENVYIQGFKPDFFYPYGFYSMFYNCVDLKKIDISNFMINYNYTFSRTFQNCQSLEEINLPNFYPGIVFSSTFIGLNNLKKIKIGKLYSTISFVSSPLLLESVLNILNALQTVENEEITFSSVTSGYIEESEEALEKIEEVSAIGWTINLN